MSSIAGTVYSDQGVTPLGSLALAVSINGAAAAATTTAAADGTYSFTGLTLVSGDVVIVYLDTGVSTNRACTVTKWGGSDLTGFNLWKDYLTCRSDNGVALSNANLATAATNADADISGVYAASAGTLTVGGTSNLKHLTIPSGHTFAPGGSCSVFGSWMNFGTFTGGGNVSLRSHTTGQTIRSNGSAFTNTLSVGDVGTPVTYTLADALSCVALTVSSGTLDTSNGNNYSLTVAGAWTSSGSPTYTLRNSTVTVSSSIPAMTVYDLVVAGTNAAKLVTGTLTVTHSFTINSGKMFSLNATSQTLVLTGATFTNSGTFVLRGNETLTDFVNDTANGGTVVYDNGTGLTITGLPTGNSYAGLAIGTISLGISTSTFKPTGSVTVSGTMTVSSGTWNANGQTVTVTGLCTVGSGGGGVYLCSTATQTFNGGLTVTGGSVGVRFTGSTGAVDVNGNLTMSHLSGSAIFLAPSGGFMVSGNWSKTNNGTFTPGTNTVTLDGTNQTISGATTFYSLVKTSAGILTWPASVKQTLTGPLDIENCSHVSSVPGTKWQIDPQGTRTVLSCSITDSNNTNASAIDASNPTNTNGGNNTNWTFASSYIPRLLTLGVG